MYKYISISILILTLILIYLYYILNTITPNIIKNKKIIINYEKIIKNNNFNECFYIVNDTIISTSRIVNYLDFHNNLILTSNNKKYKINIPFYKNDYNHIFSIKRQPRLFFGPEDARIIKVNNDILFIFNNMINNEIKMCIYNLNKKSTIVLEYEKSTKVEKNWSPFVYNNELYFSYYINPHHILKVDLLSGICKTVYNNSIIKYKYKIFGGTPSIYIKELNVYFGIGHTNKLGYLNLKRNYYCIGYMFNAQPPFNIIKLSKPFLFYDRDDTYNIYELHKVEFPLGLQKINDDIYISLGINDIDSYFLKINYMDLINQIFL